MRHWGSDIQWKLQGASPLGVHSEGMHLGMVVQVSDEAFGGKTIEAGAYNACRERI